MCCYTSLIHNEFRDEYKMAHGMFVPKGPGRAKMYDWSEKRRDPIPVPLTGTPTAKPYHGGRPPRKGHSSSSMVGGWWNDPLFAELNKCAGSAPCTPAATSPHRPRRPSARRTKGTPLPELPSIGFGKSSSSECGAFWHSKGIFEADLNNPALRSKNGPSAA